MKKVTDEVKSEDFEDLIKFGKFLSEDSTNRENDVKRNGLLKIEKSDVEFQCEKQQYLFDVLMVLLKFRGESKNESSILDYVLQEIKSYKDTSDLKIDRDEKFGMLVFVPPKIETRHTVLLDAHIDCVRSTHIDVELYTMTVKGVKGRIIMKATGIDNRFHVALLLALIRFTRFQYTRFICYFSVEEELGKLGVKRFYNETEMKKKYNVFFDEIVCLDVTRAKLKNNNVWYENPPIIGGGIVPIAQNFANYDAFGKCNAITFKALYKNVYVSRQSCGCCYMHAKESYGSLSDLFELYDVFVNDFEQMMMKNIKDGVQKKQLDEQNVKYQTDIQNMIKDIKKEKIEYAWSKFSSGSRGDKNDEE